MNVFWLTLSNSKNILTFQVTNFWVGDIFRNLFSSLCSHIALRLIVGYYTDKRGLHTECPQIKASRICTFQDWWQAKISLLTENEDFFLLSFVQK